MSIKPKKSLGQHFLTDQNIIHKIVDAIPGGPQDRVIEIGPGTGALTEVLAAHFDDLIAVETDKRAVDILKQKFDSITIIHQDILETDWTALTAGKKQIHVVGNLPYYITSPILFSLLENRGLFSDALLMMQKEVAERLVADIRTKAYGIMSVQTQLMGKPEILFPVSRRCFRPQPKVDSAMVHLGFDKDELACGDAHLKTVVRTAFNQRRKKLSNALKPVVDKKNQPEGFDYSKRAEAWPPGMYEKLTARLVEDGILT